MTTTQQSTQVIAPGIDNDPLPGEVQVSDDLRYSLNLFINNFVEADLDSFDAFPDEKELLDFAISFNLYNNISGNDGMYGYDTKQMQIAIENSDGAISYSGTGCAVIDVTDLYNYGTYYLDSYYIY